MYAIRSYYADVNDPGYRNVTFDDALRAAFHRITSYNVCYTKLLRMVLIDTHLVYKR